MNNIHINATIAATFVLMSVGAIATAQVKPPSMSEVIPSQILKTQAINQFKVEHAENQLSITDDRIISIHGPAFSQGETAEQSAEQFRTAHAGLWGLAPKDLQPVGPFSDGRHVQPIMFDETTGLYKFTGLYYTEMRGGIPVFRSRLTLLVRNEENYPLVLASADLRDLGAFQIQANPPKQANAEAAFQNARLKLANQPQFTAPRTVIWAGVENTTVTPVLAIEFTGESGDAAAGNYKKELFVADAATGAILFQESQVNNVNVTGNVSCMTTTGFGADICNPIALRPMPYARLTIVALDFNSTAYADANGNYSIVSPGLPFVTVNSSVSGNYFTVNNFTPPNSLQSQSVAPPGPANFLYNAADNSQFQRAEVNAYVQANIVRDFALSTNPSFPVIGGQSGNNAFPINVNIAQNCNAFYNGTSINFYVAGNGCTNTAFAGVVHHEYGHHLVGHGAIGQGSYGEGMSDCIAMMLSDSSCLADGFNTCGSCLRSANNTLQYPYPGEVHEAGRLLSGCVWSTRNAMAAAYPGTYRSVLSHLVLNSILLHQGTSITPQITIDFLTLDDDDSNIYNGTPHSYEINQGFSAHNMAPPFFSSVWVDFAYNGYETGTFLNPYRTLAHALGGVQIGGTISFKPGTTAETRTIKTPLTLSASGPTVRIGLQQ